MSQLRSFKIVFSSVLISWGIAVFIRFLMPRTLGPDILGNYGAAEALAIMFGTFAAWGFSSWTSVHFAAHKNEQKENATAVLHAQIMQSGLAVCFAMGALALLNYSFQVVIFAIALSISVATQQISETASRIIEAQGHFDKVARIANPVRLTFGGLSAGSLAAAFTGHLAPFSAALLVALFTLFGEVTRAILTIKSANVPIFQKPNAALMRSLFWDSKMLFVLGATPAIFARVPQIVLSKVPSEGSILPTTASELGILSAAMSLTIPLGVLVLGIQRVLVPAFAKAKENGSSAFSETFADGASLILVLAGLGSAVLILCGNSIVEILFGERFLAAKNVLRITLLTVVVQYASLLLVSSAIAWRKEKTATFGALLAFPFNIAALVLFFSFGTFQTGAEGVAWAALLYETIVVIIMYKELKAIFPVSASVLWALAFALTLATVSALASAFSVTLHANQQILFSLFLAFVLTVATAALYGRHALHILKKWK